MTTVRKACWGGAGSVVVGTGLALLFTGGCGAGTDGYDPADRYPPRQDLLVLATPPASLPRPAEPGRLAEVLAALPTVGATTLDPLALPEDQRDQLRRTLDEMFGSPAAPTVAVPDRPGGVPGFDLSPEALAHGSRVYRRLCNQCHGMTGDGKGPTGPWIYPYPRDVRTGLFKVAVGGPKPKAETLQRVIRHGVPGTAMQRFDLIPDEDLRAVTAYTVHLSARGETEFRVLKALLGESGEGDGSDVTGLARTEAGWVLAGWARAQERMPIGVPDVPPGDPADPEYQAGVRRGYGLFVGAAAGCVNCHRDFGRADFYQYDAWGAAVRSADLTRGEYKWGKEPADLAARVRHGIPASGMPANPFLTDAQVRDLVSFVRELPYPTRLPPDVREHVYPPGKSSGGR